MPKQTFTIGDFSGGMNRYSDPLDLIQKKQVPFCVNGHFDTFGKIVYQGDTPAGSDLAIRNVATKPTIADLTVGLGHATSTNSAALKLVVGTVDSPDADLSWEDGTYNFKYTVCKDLGNGIIEEGPLQLFYEASGGDNMAVDMTADDMGGFTFTHTGTAHPDWMDTDDTYEGKIAARVYYSRISGQGSVTQPGYIHLCDLILVTYDTASRILPRAIGTTGTPGTSATKINIEEPPTSASFEMNAGYPSDVGLLTDFGTEKATVQLGMLTYVAATNGGKYYIYKNLPGQPDIWPTDNWVEMPEECVNMIGIGNHLCYWSTASFIAFDVIKEAIVGHMGGLGLAHSQTAAKCGDAAIWAVGSNTAYTKVYSFNGQLKEIGKSRIQGVNGNSIKFYDDSGWIYFDHISNTYDNVYSTVTDTWFVLNYVAAGEGTSMVYMPTVDFGELGRFKKIYSFTIMGGIGHVDSDTSIVRSVYNEDLTTSLTSSFTAGTFAGSGFNGSITYTASPPVKVKAIQVILNFQEAASSPAFDATRAEIHGISFVYRRVGT
jgi:hypothetical protein